MAERKKPRYAVISEEELRALKMRLETSCGRAGFSFAETRRITLGFCTVAQHLADGTLPLPPNFFDLKKRINQLATHKDLKPKEARKMLVDRSWVLLEGFISDDILAARMGIKRPRPKAPVGEAECDSSIEIIPPKLPTPSGMVVDLRRVLEVAAALREKNKSTPTTGHNGLPDGHPGWRAISEALDQLGLSVYGLINKHEGGKLRFQEEESPVTEARQKYLAELVP